MATTLGRGPLQWAILSSLELPRGAGQTVQFRVVMLYCPGHESVVLARSEGRNGKGIAFRRKHASLGINLVFRAYCLGAISRRMCDVERDGRATAGSRRGGGTGARG